MNNKELKEIVAGSVVVINALMASPRNATSLQTSQLSFLCGQLLNNASVELSAGGPQFWIDLVACFEAAWPLATFVTMDTVRLAATGLTPLGLPGIALKNFSIRMALSEQARILAATTFVSRQDIDNYFTQINASFGAAETVAANNLDNVSYVALLTIHAAVSNDLANRSRPLPRIVPYNFGQPMPSLWLSQRIYYDPSRADELIAENKPIHPLFMPAAGVSLSV